MPTFTRPKLFNCTLYDKRDTSETINEVEVIAMNKSEALNRLNNRFFPKPSMKWRVKQIRVISVREESLKVLGKLDESFTIICTKK